MRLKIFFLIVVISVFVGLHPPVAAQDGEDGGFSPVQQNLISQVEASFADMQTWQSYKELSIEVLNYEENVTITAGTTFSIGQRIESAITTIYDENPLLNDDYNSDSLLTVQVQTENDFGDNRIQSEIYVLTVNVRYFEELLFVRGLYDGPPNAGLNDDLSIWQDISANPEQYPVFQTANLYRFLPGQNPEAGINPLLGIDFPKLLRSPLLRDMIIDIQQLSESDIILNGAGAEVVTRQIEITLDPTLVLAVAFAENPNRTALVQSFMLAEAEIKVILWLDVNTFRRVLEQYRVTVEGNPYPLHFGYGSEDVAEDGGVHVYYQFEGDILYADINIPMNILSPQD